MKFGTFLRLKDGDDFDAAFKKLKAAGFDCCHLVYKPESYTAKAADEILSAANKNGIEISALFAGFKDSATKWNISTDYLDAGINSKEYGRGRLSYLKEAAVFCTRLGVSDILIHAGFVANNPYSEDYKYMLSLVREFAEYLKELKMNLVLETGGESPVTLLRLIKEAGVGNIYANIDTANMIMYGYGNPVDAIVTLGDYVRSYHIKDGNPPTDPYELGKESYFGEGSVDFKRVFAGIKASNFDGPVIIELEIYEDCRWDRVCETLSKVKTALA
ncbi:MAG: sugar phosphate isomerase/epimerase [Oscillospiraceae bacterium]|nr:sugar phosphate isomerase/epimerase [Oscillospiraceae bacterium]